MQIPRLASTVERRLLINYRVDPDVVRVLLPTGLRPQLVDGSAVAGICLIRLANLRPAWFRPRMGWGAENAAHRIAVEWDDDSGRRTGVYIPERHSASRLAVAAGGRVFPGTHRLATIQSQETDDRIRVTLSSPNLSVTADVIVTPTLDSTLFAGLDEASEFFRKDSTGWSPTRDGRLEGLTLTTNAWRVDAAAARSVQSTFFDSLPKGSATLDCVLLMRDVPITWSVPSSRPPVEVAFS